MKNLLPAFISCVFILYFEGCASFTPGSLYMTSAFSTPGAVTKDSLSIFIREISPRESYRIFDCIPYNQGYQVLSISISNRSSSPISFIPSSIPNYVDVEEVLDETDFNPFSRLFIWSIPWFLNLAASQPFYYGIAWPIIGLIDFNKAYSANDDRTDFFQNITLKPIKLQKDQDVQGIVFVGKNYPKPLQVILVKNAQQFIFEIYPSQ